MCISEIDEDMQFTLLSDEDLFCSFYPSDGNAIGLKFLEMSDMKKIQDLIHQILDPEPKPDEKKLLKEEEKKNKLNKANNKDNKNKIDKIDEQLCVLNLVRTQKDDSVRRGAVVKALAVCTRLQILDSFKPLLTLALDNYFRNESEDGLKNLYETLNGVSFDTQYNIQNHWKLGVRQYSLYNALNNSNHVPIGSPHMRKTASSNSNSSSPGGSPITQGKRSRVASISYESPNSQNKGSATFTVPIKFNSINMHLTVPRSVGVDEITGTSVKSFFDKFKRHMSVIYNAVFTQKRIIFLGMYFCCFGYYSCYYCYYCNYCT